MDALHELLEQFTNRVVDIIDQQDYIVFNDDNENNKVNNSVNTF